MSTTISVLVADDNPVDRGFLCRVLEKSGVCKPVAVEDGLQALEALQKHEFDLLILDILMPRMDGRELFHALSQHEIEVPAIVITNVDDISVAVDLVKKGAIDYLLKPIHVDELVHKTKRAITEFDNRRQLVQLQMERQIRTEQQKLFVDWKSLYGHSEKASVHTMLKMLNTSFNEGNFMWVNFLRKNMQKDGNGNYVIGEQLIDSILEATEKQERVLKSLAEMVKSFDKDPVLKPVTLEYLAKQMKVLPTQLHEYLMVQDHQLVIYPVGEAFSDYAVEVDLRALMQIIEELVINAMKYSQPKDTIDVYMWIKTQVENDNQQVLSIAVSNPAYPVVGNEKIVGVPYAYSEQVFEIFYRLGDVPAVVYPEQWPSGTGLFFVRETIKKMGGMVEIYNSTNYLSEGNQVKVTNEVTLSIKRVGEVVMDEHKEENNENEIGDNIELF